MARIELLMPKMGESIIEATILKWVKKVGERVGLDETILEIATDKVDSEIPSPAEGTITEIFYPEDSVVEVGKVIAVISTENDSANIASTVVKEPEILPQIDSNVSNIENNIKDLKSELLIQKVPQGDKMSVDRFYSPLVKSIAKQENITGEELAKISGMGANGRVTKKDIMDYVQK
ncbi:MAG: E3 binding domain-containing protein [Saprospiraceae bacterium]|nr:E3 binding domain-containing protein [Saprospiraceae bacterium]